MNRSVSLDFILEYPAKNLDFSPMPKENGTVFAFRRSDFFRDRRARVIIHREQNQPPIAQHRHEFIEIAIVLSGTGIHATGHFRHSLQAGNVLVIHNRRSHGYEQTQNLHLVNLLVRSDHLRRLSRRLRDVAGYRALFTLGSTHWQQQSYASYLRVSAAELSQIEEWVARVEEETRHGSEGGYLLAEAYLALIIGVLSRRYGRHSDLPPPENLFERLSKWLQKNLGRHLTVTDMAREAGMSERTFYRAFRNSMGTPPVAYLHSLRLRRAAELLQQGTRAPRITEIAQACGFEDSNYFSRCFRKFSGMSPRQFRNR
jgi:AraC-like DNA-binding protein